jgi:hypothetical protein
MNEYNPQESIVAQEKYCKEKGAPHFAPKSGVCWKCRQNIYSPVEKTVFYFGNLENQKNSTLQVSQPRRLQLS